MMDDLVSDVAEICAAKTACTCSEDLRLSLECLAKARRLFSTNSSYGDSNEVVARERLFFCQLKSAVLKQMQCIVRACAH